MNMSAYAFNFNTYFCPNFGKPWVRKQAQRLARRCGIAIAANTKPGKHLEWDHPAMIRVRDFIALEIEASSVHPKLVANFDQVWQLNFRPRRRTLQQRDQEPDEHSRKPSLKKLRHVFETTLQEDLREAAFSLVRDDEDAPYVPGQKLTGGKAANVPVESYRIPRTLTTCSWADGTVARGFVTCSGDHLSETQRKGLNKDC